MWNEKIIIHALSKAIDLDDSAIYAYDQFLLKYAKENYQLQHFVFQIVIFTSRELSQKMWVRIANFLFIIKHKKCLTLEIGAAIPKSI